MTETATVDVTVNAVDDAVADSFTTQEDTPLSDDVSTNDTHSAAATYSLNADATNGTVSLNPDGTFTYTPDADYNGSDSFTYDVEDVNGDTETVTVDLTVEPVNDAPIAIDLSDRSSDDSETISLDVSGNFSDVDSGDSLTFSASGLPPGLMIDPSTGVISGVLDSSASQGGDAGSYQVTISASDGNGGSVAQNFEWTVSNPAPDAQDDSATTDEDSYLSVPSDGVLSNDIDPDGDSLGIIEVNDDTSSLNTAVSGDNGGTFIIRADGSYDFDPGSDFQQLDQGESATTSVSYTVDDGEGGKNTATLTVTVTGITDAPPTVDIDDNAPGSDTADHSVVEATGDTITGSATVAAEAGIDGVTINDTDITGATSASPVVIGGTQGQLRITGYDAASGVISYAYTEDGDAEDHSTGEILDSFALGVTDVAGETASDSLDIRIEDTTPSADDDSTTTEEDSSVTFNVLGNDDLGADGSTLTSAGLAAGYARAGTVNTDTDTGEVTFSPTSGFEGDVVIDYTITDADGDTDSAQLMVTVDPDSKPKLVGLAGRDGVADEAGLSNGSRAGDGSQITTGTFSTSVGGDAPGILTIDGDPAGDGGTYQGEFGTLEVTDNGDGDYGWTYTLTDNSTDHSSQGTGIDGIEDVFDIQLEDSEGDLTSDTLDIGIRDDVPVAGTQTGAISVAVSEQSIGGLSARWENMTTTGYRGSVDQTSDGDGLYIHWGEEEWERVWDGGWDWVQVADRSGYDFEYAEGVQSSAGVETDSSFSLGTLTHNNFPISGNAEVLDTVDMTVGFTVNIDGSPTYVETTIGFEHTETPNNGGDERDIVRITNPDQQQTITVGDREFVLSIEGFRDANDELVNTVRTFEDGSTSFDLFARVSSTDDLPSSGSNLADDVPGWGADDLAVDGSLYWEGGIQSGVIEGDYGNITVNSDGSYSYQVDRDERDDMDVGETLTETFNYTLVDDDGDEVEGILELTLNGVENNAPVVNSTSTSSLDLLNFQEFSLAPDEEEATSATQVSPYAGNDGALAGQATTGQTVAKQASQGGNKTLQADDVLSDGDDELLTGQEGSLDYQPSADKTGNRDAAPSGNGADEKVVDIPHNPIE
ncbi:Ig-like domain-containing protein [Halomonas halmophila]|uniref:Ig-like domain-containing protein n=1 Tax=Halomonas halmophila TaxID=252 RepID=UPI00147705E1|nr:Ig-like domain-containing protein [Halomonas halmophila]